LVLPHDDDDDDDDNYIFNYYFLSNESTFTPLPTNYLPELYTKLLSTWLTRNYYVTLH